jgi:DNA-binding protein HU-beta
MTMTKLEFVELVQKHGGFETRKAANQAVNAFIQSITEALVNREQVQLIGFGAFYTVEVPEKQGKIPGTDESYIKLAHTAPKFKFGKTVRELVGE